MHYDAAASKDVPLYPATDHDGIGFDISLNDGTLINNKCVLRKDFSFKFPTDTHGPLEGQSTFKAGPLVQKGRHMFAAYLVAEEF
jgi:hypothetical protein